MPELNKKEILERAQADGLRRALIVTALSLEMKAVRAHLTHIGSVLGRSGTIYECGQFSASGTEWLIVVAQSGAGTHPAHNVVTSAFIDFEQFEVVFFVGIAGSRKEEACIGTVVASSYLYSPYSGKYDSSLGFSSRPHALPVDQRMIGCATKVEREADWPARICQPLKTKLPVQSEYPQPFPPAAFIAPIASIEAVSADPASDLETKISLHYGDALAVEMEGYGAAFAAYSERSPFIVVRGISDMRGGKTAKNDAVHQPVAAAHAAAFAFEMVDVWGQFHPFSGNSNSVVGQQGSNLTLAQDTATSENVKTQRRIIVMNFEGGSGDFPTDKITAIVQALKTISKDESLRVIGVEEGSLRLLIEGDSKNLDGITAYDISGTLQRDLSVKLLGVLEEQEYRKAQNFECLLQNASRDLLEWPNTLPDGTHLERVEFDQLLSIVSNNEKSTTAVLGAPGSGKSALLASFGKELCRQGTPFLAIKADLLSPEILTEDDLTSFLSLSEQVSSVLIQLSHLRPVVLLIDQLDALAGYVDLRTGRLSVLLNLVRKLGNRKNIHIVLSARTFEFEHDTRLKAVRAESLEIALPPWSAVLKVLENNGIQAAGWPSDAQELMRAPQALATFLKLKDRGNEPPFRTYQSMLDQLWKERILNQLNGPRISRLAVQIAKCMAETESLWIAAVKFEDQADDLTVLIANQILTDYDGTGSRVGFSHQTVFEHALARAFALGNEQLSSYILERQSSLFIRPKLWAALTYLRDVEPATYHAEFNTLWLKQDLRPHLRHLLVEFLGQQSSPMTIETAAFDEALNSPDRRVALQALIGSIGWFKFLSFTHISAAMIDENEVNVAAAILDKAWSFAPETVRSLIKKNWLSTPVFDGCLWHVLQNCPEWDDDVTAIAIAVIARTEIAPFAFDQMLSSVGLEQPKTALKLASFKLSLELGIAIKEAEARSLSGSPKDDNDRILWYMKNSPSKPLTDVLENQNGWDSLEELAKANGMLFLEYFWPCFKEAMAALRLVREDSRILGYPIQYHLDFRFPEECSLGLAEPPLLGAFATSIAAFAHENENEFLKWLATNENEDATPAQRLFAHALSCDPKRYAERAAKFLLDDFRRLYLGSIEDCSGTTKRLVKTASPHWPNELLIDFAKNIIQYPASLPEGLEPIRRKHLNEMIRRTKLTVLSALQADRLPQEVRRYLDEERRRYPDEKVGVTFHGPSWIGSSMTAQNMAKASDADVLNAFRKIPDGSDWDHPTRWMEGGNIQLSREFAEFSKIDTKRAINLIRQFEPAYGARGAGYALDAMAEALEPSIILELIDSLNERGFEGSEFRDSSARAVTRLVRRDVAISDRVLEILESWLAEPIPAERQNDDANKSNGSANYSSNKKVEEVSESVLWGHGGLSILPHGNFPVLETITRALLARPDHDRLVSFYFKHLLINEEKKVWQGLFSFFRYIRPSEPARFADLVLTIFKRFPALSSTRDAAVMLAHLHWRHPDVVRQVISSWTHSDVRELEQAYGELVGLIALVQPQLDWAQEMLAQIIENESLTRARVGAAYAAVNLWAEPNRNYKLGASEVLRLIAKKADHDAWSAIFDLFRLVDEITPEKEWISFLETVSEFLQEAGKIDSSYIVDRLQTLLPHQALLVAKIAKGLVASWRNDLGDLRSGTAFVARDLVDLAITLHRLGPETREIGTSLFEDLLRVSAYTARETMDEIDNRFRSTPTPARRRLPRRKRR